MGDPDRDSRETDPEPRRASGASGPYAAPQAGLGPDPAGIQLDPERERRGRRVAHHAGSTFLFGTWIVYGTDWLAFSTQFFRSSILGLLLLCMGATYLLAGRFAGTARPLAAGVFLTWTVPSRVVIGLRVGWSEVLRPDVAACLRVAFEVSVAVGLFAIGLAWRTHALSRAERREEAPRRRDETSSVGP